jgi:hypothetical protein
VIPGWLNNGGCIAPECEELREVGSVFCRKHLDAPAGQRGGWLSAERRRRKMAGGPILSDVKLDANNIVRRLWIGGEPPMDRHLPGFDVLTLCAEEIQPRVVAFRGNILRVPLPDAKLDGSETSRAVIGARHVARHLSGGKRVLVTCAMGRNRSALVAGLALGMVTKMSGPQIAELIRQRRHPDCLSNPHFVTLLRQLLPGRA